MNWEKSPSQHILTQLSSFSLCGVCLCLFICLIVWFPVPGAPPRKLEAEALNSTAIRVTWKPPLQIKQHGQIRGYQVIYSRLENGEPRGQPNIMDVALPEAQVQNDVSLFSSVSLSFLNCDYPVQTSYNFHSLLSSYYLTSHFDSLLFGDTLRTFFLSTPVSSLCLFYFILFFYLSPHVTFDSKLVPCSYSFGLAVWTKST